MKIKEIKISPRFEKHYKKLPKHIKEKAKRKEKILCCRSLKIKKRNF